MPDPDETLPPPITPLAKPLVLQAVGVSADDTALAPQPPATIEDTLDDAAKQAFLWKVHDYLGEYARFADTKAAFAGTLAGAMLGALYGARLFTPLVSISFHVWTFSNWLSLAAALFLVSAVCLTLHTVYPRLRATQGQGFIFWGNLKAFQNAETLRTSFHSQSAKTLNDHLLNQNFTVAKFVCTPKYRNISLALILLGLGGVCAVGALLSKDRAVAEQSTSTALSHHPM